MKNYKRHYEKHAAIMQKKHDQTTIFLAHALIQYKENLCSLQLNTECGLLKICVTAN